MTLRMKLIFSFLAMALLVATTGLSGAYFIQEVGADGERMGEGLAPLGQAAKDIQITATTAHLKFEEIMAGDATESYDDVKALLAETLAYTDLILNGGEKDGLIYQATKSDEVRGIIGEVRESVLKFIDSADKRYSQRKGSTGVGSEYDTRFDALYQELQGELDKLIAEQRSGTEAGAVDTVAALGQAKYLLANGHLFLEEVLSGDEGETVDAVIADFNGAKAVLAPLATGRHSAHIQELNVKIDAFIEAGVKRVEGLKSVASAGSKVDAEFDASFDAFTSKAAQAELIINTDILAAVQEGRMTQDQALTTTVIISVVSLVVAILLATLLGRMVARRVYDLSGTMQALVDGKLDVAVGGGTQRDEFGDMAKAVEVFKQNAVKIRDMEDAADRIIESIAQTTSEVSSAVSEQAATTSEQAAAVTQTSTSLEEIRESADNAMSRASDLSGSAEQTLLQGEAGQRDMQHVVEAMGDIRDKVNAIAHTMMALSEQTRRVGEITDSVSALAQQSKMLAINASIEAAKAGEAGRGFAVVAEEVANLAEQSEQATTQVRSVLDQIQSASEKAIFATEEGTKQVDAGVTLIQNVGDGMKNLLTVIDDTVASTRNMLEIMRQQSTGIQQVNTAMTDISQGTNQIASSTSQIRGTMENLMDAVDQLRNSRT